MNLEMHELYTKQSLPDKEYRALLGSALCVFNSNNAFIIENILRIDSIKSHVFWQNSTQTKIPSHLQH